MMETITTTGKRTTRWQNLIPLSNERRNFKTDKTTNSTTENNVLTKPCACEDIIGIQNVLKSVYTEHNSSTKCTLR